MTKDQQTGARLQDGEEVVLALRQTGWDATLANVATFGLRLPWWKARWYVVTDRRLISKTGILNKTEVSLPLHFVQDAAVHTTWQGIGHVVLSTAGGSASISRITSLQPEDARHIAHTIMEQARRVNVNVGPTSNRTGDVGEALARLASLRESGVLTDEEFAQQKARLLS